MMWGGDDEDDLLAGQEELVGHSARVPISLVVDGVEAGCPVNAAGAA